MLIGRPQFCRRAVTRGMVVALTLVRWELQRFRPFCSGVDLDFRFCGGHWKVAEEASDNADEDELKP